MRGASNKSKNILHSPMHSIAATPTRKSAVGGGSFNRNPTPALSKPRDMGPSAASEKFTEGMMPSKGGKSTVATTMITGIGRGLGSGSKKK